MVNGLTFFIPAGFLALALLAKLPGIRKAWDDPLLRSVGWMLLIAAGVLCFAAPPTIAAMNDLTGVPNFSAPLVYVLLTVFSAACIRLIVNWQSGGDPAYVRRATLWWMVGYGVTCLLIVALFIVGDAPVERLRDFDPYYASTPFIREMILLYLLAHTVASVLMTVLCWRWSRLDINRWLRTGLVMIVVGYSLNLGYDICKFAAIGARWSGHNWDWLSTYVAPPMAAVSAVIIPVGFVLPLAGQRFSIMRRDWQAYRHLAPLAAELEELKVGGVIELSRTDTSLRLTQREADINDAILSLHPLLDPELRARALVAATAHGLSQADAGAVADAVMLISAKHRRAQQHASTQHSETAAMLVGRDLDAAPPRDLLRISRLLRHPLVDELARTPFAESSPA
ncbi:MAB_1171c family putative transporter [Streptomyces zhihengii]|uniref:MAB_1171c family putative transporter n=1 Tax=Streptomyces zhihengii TaxID=1818004 RepID=UPI00364272B8